MVQAPLHGLVSPVRVSSILRRGGSRVHRAFPASKPICLAIVARAQRWLPLKKLFFCAITIPPPFPVVTLQRDRGPVPPSHPPDRPPASPSPTWPEPSGKEHNEILSPHPVRSDRERVGSPEIPERARGDSRETAGRHPRRISRSLRPIMASGCADTQW